MVTSVYKWLCVPVILIFMNFSQHPAKPYPVTHAIKVHPYYVSVTEINHNAAEKMLEVSCKIFTDDFEKALEEKYKTQVDLVKPVNKAALDKLIMDYILKRLAIKIDNKPVSLIYQGFEHEDEAVYNYFEVSNITSVKKVEVVNSLLYDMYDNEVNIVHAIVGGVRKSTKLEQPHTGATFQF